MEVIWVLWMILVGIIGFIASIFAVLSLGEAFKAILQEESAYAIVRGLKFEESDPFEEIGFLLIDTGLPGLFFLALLGAEATIWWLCF